MNTFNVGEQRAGNIYQAGNIYLGAQPKKHAQSGIKALAAHDYQIARLHLGRAVDEDHADAASHYRLALALLDGQRPHMHSSAVIQSIQNHLALAAEIPEAQVLLILVKEDYYLTWQHSNAVPAELVELVRSIPAASAQEIAEHVPAEQSRVWRLLAARATGGIS